MRNASEASNHDFEVAGRVFVPDPSGTGMYVEVKGATVARDLESAIRADQERVWGSPAMAARADGPTVAEGVSSKVQRILAMAAQIEGMADNLQQKLISPSLAKGLATERVPEPEPSHLVFALEAAERRLDRIAAYLDRCHAAVS